MIHNWYHRHTHVPQLFFSSLARSKCPCVILLPFTFILRPVARQKPCNILFLFFFLLRLGSSDRSYFKLPKNFIRLFSRMHSGFGIYHLTVWLNYHLYYENFSHHQSLRDSKSSQISKTLFRILADLINSVVWILSTRPLISKFSSPFANPLVTVPRAPITIGITIIFTFHSVFNFSISRQSPGTYPSFHFHSILLFGRPGQQSPQFCKFSFCCWSLYVRVIWPRLSDLFVYQNPGGVCTFNSPGQNLACAYTIYLYGQI